MKFTLWQVKLTYEANKEEDISNAPAWESIPVPMIATFEYENILEFSQLEKLPDKLGLYLSKLGYTTAPNLDSRIKVPDYICLQSDPSNDEKDDSLETETTVKVSMIIYGYKPQPLITWEQAFAALASDFYRGVPSTWQLLIDAANKELLQTEPGQEMAKRYREALKGAVLSVHRTRIKEMCTPDSSLKDDIAEFVDTFFVFRQIKVEYKEVLGHITLEQDSSSRTNAV